MKCKCCHDTFIRHDAELCTDCELNIEYLKQMTEYEMYEAVVEVCGFQKHLEYMIKVGIVKGSVTECKR